MTIRTVTELLTFKNRWICKGICVFVFSVIFFSCEKVEIESWYQKQYVFLEQHLYEHSELIEGECLHQCIGSPIYGFDSLAGTLNVWTNRIKMNESIVMVLGEGLSLNGDAGSGICTGISSIETLPHKQINFIITKIDSKGVIYFQYKDSAIILFPNEEWVNISNSILPAIEWNGDTIGYVKYTYTDRIKNWGLLKKDKFIEVE